MADDDMATIRAITEHRERIAAGIARHQGRLVDSPGDNLLAEFPSALGATRCAVEIQGELAVSNAELPSRRRMEFRIGVHLGDVIADAGRIYGDGVNIAARLQGLAEPGGICVSRIVRELVGERLDVRYDDIGERRVKNIPTPVHAYQVRLESTAEADVVSRPGEATALAVLPFEIFGNDSAQEHFADGLVEDLITRLSGLGLFPVVARNSTFVYKGRAVDVRRLMRELEARFVVEGSVRRVGDQVRVSAQLIDAATGHHLWAEKFDRPVRDALSLQDELTEAIVGSMRVALSRSAPVPPDTELPPTGAALVGRRDEVARLERLLERAVSGRGSAALLVGEAGIGKTRVAEEATRRARSRGMIVAAGRSHAGEGLPAGWPWIEILREFGRDPRTAPLVEAARRREPPLALLLPEEGSASAAESEVAGPKEGRFLLFDAVWRLLRASAEVRPLVLLLEDLHWADTASLQLFEFLAGRVASAPLVLVGTHRRDETCAEGRLATLQLELSRGIGNQRLELGGLSREESGALLAQIVDGMNEQLVDAVHARSEGNPLFLEEFAWQLRVSPPDDAEIAIPHTVREVIERRLEGLGPPLREALSVASVLGRSFRADALGRTAGLSDEEIDRLLDEAARAHVVERLVERTPGYHFTHALIREVLYVALPVAKRTRLHARAAEVLEGLYQADLRFRAEELAYHFGAGLPKTDRIKATHYATLAGDEARSRFAYDEAAANYARALALAHEDCRASDEQRCELLLAMAESQHRAGAREGTFEAFHQAAELARARGDAHALARAAVGLAGVGTPFGADVSREAPLLEEALEMLGPDDGRHKARVLSRLAALPQSGHEQVRLAVSRAECAVEIARRLRDAETLAHALLGHRTALEGPEHLEERIECDRELVEVARRSRNPEMQIVGHYGLIVDYLEVGDRARMDREIEEHERLARDLHQALHRWRAMRVRAMRALLDGEFERAERYASEALRLGSRDATVDAVLNYGVQIFRVRWAQGRLAELEGQLRGLAEQHPASLAARCGLALLQCETGREGDARAEFERLHERGFTELPRGPEWSTAATALAEVAARLRARAGAEALYRLFLSYEGRSVVVGATCCFGSGSYYLGLLAGTAGHWAQARKHFELARELHGRLGARGLTARTLYEYGRLAIEIGGSVERARGLEMLRSASDLAERLGMIGLSKSAATAARRRARH
jgi:TolB-like protein/tetratricopeptide (TPR) repeat protein